ncbi:FAD-dependent oxidoreductase [Nakamurella lactea]|uniref:FAD-dependent oxidoreductase n=1 Tax=Nakamurella lactea TaxID=459515 RepID=UPI000490CDAE|nr:FAD-dependent oxidoreductase [Nakamurella lactea]
MRPGPTVREAARDLPVFAAVDVLVVGGGPAGVSAAVGAARMGAKTLLLERHGFLGGMWTAGMVLTLAGYNCWLRPYVRAVDGVPGEWLRRAVSLGGAEDNAGFVLNSEPEVMKLVADELLAEAGAETLFHTWAAAPIVQGGAVVGLCIENVDGRSAVLAGATVDCTGDGEVFARAGNAWEKSDSLQPMTMPFRMVGAALDPAISHSAPQCVPIGPEPGMLGEPVLGDHSSRRNDVPFDPRLMRQQRAAGRLPSYGGPWFGGLDKDVLWVNSTRHYGDASNVRDLTRAEIEGRRSSRAISEFLTRTPGLQGARLLQTSTQIGVRETRRLVGNYTMTGNDVRSGTAFNDSVAVGCWPIDVHPADGEVGMHQMYVPLPYGIPYRSLIPRTVEGLVVAGRCISVDRDALGSTRVGATCAAIGHAAGVAAALAAGDGVSPSRVDVAALQGALIEQGAIVSPGQVG